MKYLLCLLLDTVAVAVAQTDFNERSKTFPVLVSSTIPFKTIYMPRTTVTTNAAEQVVVTVTFDSYEQFQLMTNHLWPHIGRR